MSKEELIEFIDILDKSEVHIENGGKILVFIDFEKLEKITKLLGIDSQNYMECILTDKYIVIDLIKIDILDCEEIEIIENRYKKVR